MGPLPLRLALSENTNWVVQSDCYWKSVSVTLLVYIEFCKVRVIVRFRLFEPQVPEP